MSSDEDIVAGSFRVYLWLKVWSRGKEMLWELQVRLIGAISLQLSHTAFELKSVLDLFRQIQLQKCPLTVEVWFAFS